MIRNNIASGNVGVYAYQINMGVYRQFDMGGREKVSGVIKLLFLIRDNFSGKLHNCFIYEILLDIFMRESVPFAVRRLRTPMYIVDILFSYSQST